ncbi:MULTISPECIES: hypothetical protein [unclassified Nocardioides]|uniref:hypothetical protein n=1 Tax=unclassified Nocardioides TaxID=2615069 RepID=UPI0006FCC1BE|nr:MULTISPECIES: hypothetical protein [unclassified Nocardioides]KQY57368.1 hypothetical protein ASD30_14235 [Nocardioides sp. Root140]KQZ68881.1 hypothetical protein ASD66_16655 [Nocardioides sp. Root151]KRF20442.1 hypothetical protein ASH02_22330 [Nocardioides sp. Soil796]
MSENVTAELIRALVDHMGGPVVDWDGWESLAMILEFPGGEFNEAHGFLYSPDGTISAVASDSGAVRPAVDAYTDSHYQPGEARPVQVLVQFDRGSGKYTVSIEDADETRWKMTPRNRNEFRDGLRPRFD